MALVMAALLALAACGGNLFGSSSSSSSAPSQSGYYNGQSHDTGMPGPGTHDQNRD
ncbi:MAG TPA: hypothetical protein VHW66_17845 [Stellaceae bacterium]|nr:hypothetical protein [Stellaceae bacterium]